MTEANRITNLNKHPAEYYIRYLILRDPSATDAVLMKNLDDWAFLQPSTSYWGFARQRLANRPIGFDPANRFHRESMKFLRDNQVYDLFYPTEAVDQAWSILADPNQRLIIEQVLMARLDLKTAAQKLNRKNGWFLTAEGLQTFYHFFWNVKLLTFDEWGRFLYERTAMYDRHLALLQAPPQLAYFHLRLEQVIESKRMIQRVQEIAYNMIEEINLRPGIAQDKVKAVGILGKTVIEAHNSLSTSDMALKDVLQQFERFRMEHPLKTPPDIRQLAPGGNYTGSGVEVEKEEPKVH